MQIAQALAGFTAGEADILRRLWVKKESRIRQTKRKIYSRSNYAWIAKDVANFGFAKIEPFAQYSLTKSCSCI